MAKKRNKKYTGKFKNRPNWTERMSSLTPQMAMDCMKAPLAAADQIAKGNANDDHLSYVSCVIRAMVLLAKHYEENDEIVKLSKDAYAAFVRIYDDATEKHTYSIEDAELVQAAVQTYADMVEISRRGEVWDAFEEAQRTVFSPNYDWRKV